jgi:lipopolysaccharide export system protein LptA
MTQRLWLFALTVAMAASGAALAQNPAAQSLRSPIQGVLQDQQNQDLPVQIDAASLEVQDKNKMATFSGDVHVTQGDMTMKCQSLVVFYGPERGSGTGSTVASITPPANAPPGAKGAMPQGAQDIRRIEARGGVTVSSKDQNASGDLGVYDLKKKTITLTGNVVVSQGKNVLRGERVVVDTVSGNAHFESGSATQNRVRALILPSKGANGGGSSNILSVGQPKAN